jgi:Winged helix DNA-binding domain
VNAVGRTHRPDEGTVLDRRTLNRSLLARQLLLERVDLPAVDAVEHLVGMQAQVPLDPYIGLWSRLRAFDPDALGNALLERRLVRMTLMRATLHLVSARDGLALRPVVQAAIERAFASSPFAAHLSDLELGPVISRGIELVEHEPLSISQLAAALSKDWPHHDSNSLAYAFRYLVPLVQVTPRGVWGRTLQPKVTTLDAWLGRPSASALSVDELVIRYLRAFGPASAADVRAWSWLGGVRAIIERLRSTLCVYRDEHGRDLYDVREGVFCDRAAPAPVRFLPQYDNLFLAHADRARIMDGVKWDGSFLHHGTVFVDGFLSGAWKLSEQRREATLIVELRTRVAPTEYKHVRREAEKLLLFRTPDARTRRLDLRSG